MVIDKICKMSIKGVKLKSESFFSISPGVLELWRKNLRGGRFRPPGPDRVKGLRQHITKTNNPSTIGPDELLTVRFPDLKENQVIIPGTTKLTFNITLAGTDVNRTLVGNLGRNIIRKLIVKLEGNEIISIDDYNVLYSYYDC